MVCCNMSRCCSVKSSPSASLLSVMILGMEGLRLITARDGNVAVWHQAEVGIAAAIGRYCVILVIVGLQSDFTLAFMGCEVGPGAPFRFRGTTTITSGLRAVEASGRRTVLLAPTSTDEAAQEVACF